MDHHLGDAAPVPQVEEEHAAMVAAPLHPGLEPHLAADVLAGERPGSAPGQTS